jgi:hypothetical protein
MKGYGYLTDLLQFQHYHRKRRKFNCQFPSFQCCSFKDRRPDRVRIFECIVIIDFSGSQIRPETDL